MLNYAWLALIVTRYICEISPPGYRGPLTAGPQLLNTLGLLVGYFSCYGTARMESSLAWRTPFILLTGLSVMFAIAATLWLVPSPRWPALSGRHDEVSAAWEVLEVRCHDCEKADIEIRTTVAGVENSVNSIDTCGESEANFALVSNPKTGHSFFDVFRKQYRVRTGLAVFLLSMQQLSGIDGVLYVGAPNGSSKNMLMLSSMRLFFLHTPVSHLQMIRSLLAEL